MRRLNGYTWRTGVLEIVMIAAGLLFMFPIYILIINAIKPRSEQSSPMTFPLAPTLENFAEAWNEAHLGSAMLNSLIVTVGSVVVLVFVGAMAAYPLARLTHGWSRLAYYLFMLGLVIPFQLALIPLYFTLRDVGLIGTLLGLIVIYGGIQAPLTIFLYTEFIRSVPLDYDEAAEIDGANRMQTFWRVIFPLVAPITGTVIVLNAVLIWNDFFVPLLFLSGSGNVTLPLAIFQFTGQYSSQWGLIFAALLIGSIPIVAAFLIMQRAVFRGYATGIKG